MLDLTNRGYPGENEWQLWCQCHNKCGMTCVMMSPILPGLQHQNKWSNLGEKLSLLNSLGQNLRNLDITITKIYRFHCSVVLRVTQGKWCLVAKASIEQILLISSVVYLTSWIRIYQVPKIRCLKKYTKMTMGTLKLSALFKILHVFLIKQTDSSGKMVIDRCNHSHDINLFSGRWQAL